MRSPTLFVAHRTCVPRAIPPPDRPSPFSAAWNESFRPDSVFVCFITKMRHALSETQSGSRLPRLGSLSSPPAAPAQPHPPARPRLPRWSSILRDELHALHLALISAHIHHPILLHVTPAMLPDKPSPPDVCCIQLFSPALSILVSARSPSRILATLPSDISVMTPPANFPKSLSTLPPGNLATLPSHFLLISLHCLPFCRKNSPCNQARNLCSHTPPKTHLTNLP